MDYNQALESEYQKAGKKAVFCQIGKERVIVPLSYNGNVNDFIDDIFAYDKEASKYQKYNESCTRKEDILDCEMLKYGDIMFLPPFDLVHKNIEESQIIKRAAKRALRKYRAAIKQTLRVAQEYPQQDFAINMNSDRLAEIKALHYKYCGKKVAQKVGAFLKFSTQQIAQMSAGAVGCLPMAAYKMLDKKYHFANNKVKQTIDRKVVPYISRGALKAIIPLTLVGAMKFNSNTSEAKNLQSGTVATTMTPQQTNTTVTDSTTTKHEHARFAINSAEDFDRLFDAAKADIYLSMFPTEILVNEAYSDNGKDVNTIGLGSYYYPANGDPQSSEWILTKKYVKKHGKIKCDGKKAIALAEGWFKHRGNGYVYKDMCRRLQGCELTTNELAAIATIMYNNEAHGRQICDFIRQNYQDPVKCALEIMKLRPKNEKFTDGIIKRHAHEALQYLNVDGYADRVKYFYVKEGVNSKGQTYYTTSVSQLKSEKCLPMLEGLERGDLTEARKLAHQICNYTCKGGERVYAIADKNGVGFLHDGSEPLDLGIIQQMTACEDIYKLGLKHYQNGEYQQALNSFQTMLDNGYDGADIHNDMAITYYNMGKYEECIKECQLVVNTGETLLYAPANFNAGKAYEQLGDRDKALKNYELALKRDSKNPAYKNAVQRLQNNNAVAQNITRSRKARS